MIKNKRRIHLAIVIPHPALHAPTPAALFSHNPRRSVRPRGCRMSEQQSRGVPPLSSALGHGPYGEQVAANTISLEEVEAKCEKGEK